MPHATDSRTPWAPDRGRPPQLRDHATNEAVSAQPVAQRDELGGDPTLRAIVAMARQGVEGCDLASGILIRDDKADVTETSDPLAADLDRRQHELGQGPGPDARSTSSIITSDDLGADARWPSFGRHARRCGMAAVVSVPLVPVREFPWWSGWLTLYGRHPGPLPATSIALAETLGLYFSTAVNSSLHAQSLEAALASRDLIGQAKGIIMARKNVDDERAFRILQQASQHTNRRLRDVAAEIVRSCGRHVSVP